MLSELSPLMNPPARTCTIRADGHLDDHWCAWLGHLNTTRHDDGTTTVTVPGGRSGAAPRRPRRPARPRRRPHRRPYHRTAGPQLAVRARPPAAHRAPHPPSRHHRPRGPDLEVPPG